MIHPRPDVRRRLVDAIGGRVDVLGLSPEDTAELLDTADREGLGRLLRARHRELGRPSHAALAHAVLADDATRRAVRLLEDDGIPCAVLKGTAVAALAWEEPALREQGDVDLLVRAEDVERSAAVLSKGGLVAATKLDGPDWHHVVLTMPPPHAMSLELHRELSVDVSLAVSARELLDRRIRVATPGGELPTLSHEDAIVYLGVHAAVHTFERLAWLVDIDGYARRQPVEWDVAVDRARAWGAAVAVAVAWSESLRVFQSPIPTRVVPGLGVAWIRRALSDLLLAGASRANGRVREALGRSFRLSLAPSSGALRDTVQRKLRARAQSRRGP